VGGIRRVVGMGDVFWELEKVAWSGLMDGMYDTIGGATGGAMV
jgi:hypothetical protein